MSQQQQYVAGDIGGHLEVLTRILKQVGVDSNLRLPEGTSVVQVGDLVRISPHFRDSNTRIVRIVDQLIDVNGDKWTQLCGNHECAALGGPARSKWEVAESIDVPCREILEDLWRDGRMKLAVASKGRLKLPPNSADIVADAEFLITHAGYTQGKWRQDNSPATPHLAAEMINQDCGKSLVEVSNPGSLVTERRTQDADTMWAEVNRELLEPWMLQKHLPFSQVHGHASPFHWPDYDWWPDTPSAIREHTHVDPVARRSITGPLVSSRRMDQISPPFFISVDWTLEDQSPEQIWPLLRIEESSRV